MDNIIDEYLSLDLIQKQMLFNKHNIDFYFKKKKQDAEPTANHQSPGSFTNIFDNLRKAKDEKATIGEKKKGGTCPQHDDPRFSHFEVNQKNIKLINYKENRLSEEVKVAIQIEHDAADQIQALKNQGVAHFGQVVS